MKKSLPLCILLLAQLTGLCQYVASEKPLPGGFALVKPGASSCIYTDSTDFATVQKAAALLASDLEAVSGQHIPVVHRIPVKAATLIVVGTAGRSGAVRQLLQEKKIHPLSILHQWEAYQVQTLTSPFNGIDNMLVIAGSDRRGAAYGALELSRQIGVSPWYWWADVPVIKKTAIYLRLLNTATNAPKVKYRGIFINDEAPALSGWSREKFGGFNSRFYAKVFELMLRLKANYLWPAMWGNAFYDDDSLNIKAAEEYGIVIGTSHHEPLMRAHVEWKRYGKGKWNYDSNEARLKDFWKLGMQRAANEKIVTVGMRGDGDEPMTRETATALLERIVKDQRQIIEEVTGRPASETPQLWALYKEVQDYYDKGMRVPEDVTLLLCDDNWGNIRKLPPVNSKPRKGGYGIYYHFDYVGDPRNYKWLNTNPLPRIWEQMHLAYEHDVRNIWIVNVGDIKPMELPISFFLDYAWNPGAIDAAGIQPYTRQWAAEQFGPLHAPAIADILSRYAKYNGRRKPELLNEKVYSLTHYQEADRVTAEWQQLQSRAEKIQASLPPAYSDAYFELVAHPLKACTNLQQLYTTVAWNQWYAAKHDPAANPLADKARQLYLQDSLISLQYHRLGNGKWNHMMSQTHIGYTYWQQPDVQKMPAVVYVSPDTAARAVPGNIPVNTIPKTARQLVPSTARGNIFYEQNGYVSIEAAHFTKAVNGNTIAWKLLPDLGRTGSAVTSFPVTAAAQQPGIRSPRLQYEVYVYDKGPASLQAFFSPTLNFNHDEGLQYAISVDNELPQVISINKEDNQPAVWGKWVSDNIIIKETSHMISRPGKHTISFWRVSPGVVLQKLVMNLGGLEDSYLGPPETKWSNK